MSAFDDTMVKFSALLADGDEPPAILPLAAASRLREALPAICEEISISRNFSVGDIVRQRSGFVALATRRVRFLGYSFVISFHAYAFFRASQIACIEESLP